MVPSQEACVADLGTTAPTTTTTAIASEKLTTAEERVVVPRQTINPVKAESKRLLKQVWSAASLEDAKKIASRSVELYDGKGLHVLSSVNAVALFPGGLRAAVNLLKVIIMKLVFQVVLALQHKAFWASVRRSKGKFARQFKIIDKTLVCMANLHWIKCSARGQPMKPNPLELFDLTTAAWEYLLKKVPHSHIKNKYLSVDQPRIFALSRTVLVDLRSRHAANAIALKAVGYHFPQELVDMVATYTHRASMSMKDTVSMIRITGQAQERARTGLSQEALLDAMFRTSHNWFWCSANEAHGQEELDNVGLRRALTKEENDP